MSNSTRSLVIGSRGSKLALVQTEEVKKMLQEKYPNTSMEMQIIKTKGDQNFGCCTFQDWRQRTFYKRT